MFLRQNLPLLNGNYHLNINLTIPQLQQLNRGHQWAWLHSGESTHAPRHPDRGNFSSHPGFRERYVLCLSKLHQQHRSIQLQVIGSKETPPHRRCRWFQHRQSTALSGFTSHDFNLAEVSCLPSGYRQFRLDANLCLGLSCEQLVPDWRWCSCDTGLQAKELRRNYLINFS